MMWHMRGCGWCRSGRACFGTWQREIYQWEGDILGRQDINGCDVNCAVEGGQNEYKHGHKSCGGGGQIRGARGRERLGVWAMGTGSSRRLSPSPGRARLVLALVEPGSTLYIVARHCIPKDVRVQVHKRCTCAGGQGSC